MNGDYKKSADRYTIPPDLLKNTAKLMQKAYEQRGQQPQEEPPLPFPAVKKPKPRKFSRRIAYGSAIAAASLLLLLVPASRTLNRSPIITVLTDGQHIQTVELKDGSLTFAPQDEFDMSIGPNFGVWLSPVPYDMDRYQDYLEETPIPQREIEGYQMQQESITIYETHGTIAYDALSRTYTNQSGHVFEVVYAKKYKSNPKFTKMPPNSHIGKTGLFMAWNETKGIYTAEFVKEDMGYIVTAKNIEQEDFINFILKILQ